MTSDESINSVFNITTENNSFSVTIPGYWKSRGNTEKIKQLGEVIKLRKQKDIDIHVQEVRKRGNQKKVEDNENKLSDFDTRKNEINEEFEHKSVTISKKWLSG